MKAYFLHLKKFACSHGWADTQTRKHVNKWFWAEQFLKKTRRASGLKIDVLVVYITPQSCKLHNPFCW